MNETISEFINNNFKVHTQARLDKLTAIGAPKSIQQSLTKKLENPNYDYSSEVGKIKDFGQLTITSFETKKYRRGMGVTFQTEQGQEVLLIPGPHSWFLTTNKKEQ